MGTIISNIDQVVIIMESVACTPGEDFGTHPREIIPTVVIDIGDYLEQNPGVGSHDMDMRTQDYYTN